MTTGAQLLTRASHGVGDHYKFGGEVLLDDPDPDFYDCSEYVQWCCHMEGINAPDGAFNQWKWCTPVPVPFALKTPGALLFVGDGTGSGRDAIVHVAFSRGNGTTFEARGTKWGVGTWSAAGRFDYAGLIPKVDYTVHPVPPRPVPQEDDMLKIFQCDPKRDDWPGIKPHQFKSDGTKRGTEYLVTPGHAQSLEDSKLLDPTVQYKSPSLLAELVSDADLKVLGLERPAGAKYWAP